MIVKFTFVSNAIRVGRNKAVHRCFLVCFQHATRPDGRAKWIPYSSITGKIGCTAQTLNEWVKRFERDSGVRAGVPSEVAERLKALERENRDLRQVNEILRKASAYFAQAELDRWFKP